MPKNSGPSKQPCWFCAKACGRCNWSRHLEPIEGWDAEKVDYPGGSTVTWTYAINSCPEYEAEVRA